MSHYNDLSVSVFKLLLLEARCVTMWYMLPGYYGTDLYTQHTRASVFSILHLPVSRHQTYGADCAFIVDSFTLWEMLAEDIRQAASLHEI